MALEKLVFTPLDKNFNPLPVKSIKVLFNPTEYTISKSVSWDSEGKKDKRFNAPAIDFGGGGSRQLSLKLFYDVTEPINGRMIRDVREETSKLAQLTRIDRDLQYPPLVRVSWGNAPKGSGFPFTGAITSLNQTFVLFSGNGEPLRANIDVTLLEYINQEMDLLETDPEMTTYRVKRGDTLTNITAAMYGEPSQWRRIAEANGIDDPRNLTPGKVLSIPEIL